MYLALSDCHVGAAAVRCEQPVDEGEHVRRGERLQRRAAPLAVAQCEEHGGARAQLGRVHGHELDGAPGGGAGTRDCAKHVGRAGGAGVYICAHRAYDHRGMSRYARAHEPTEYMVLFGCSSLFDACLAESDRFGQEELEEELTRANDRGGGQLRFIDLVCCKLALE